MAILLVKIENEDSLSLNEFFDYGGYCYALSCGRNERKEECIDFSTFFEASIKTTELRNITTVFVNSFDQTVIGWYKNASIFKYVKQPSLFLEGNVVAPSSEVVLLKAANRSVKVNFFEKNRCYEVIEMEDERFDPLAELFAGYQGENYFVRYPYAEAKLIPSAIKSLEACNEACEYYASRILNNGCNGIVEIKLLEKYGEKLSQMSPKSADGYYYTALAQYHLGFPKKAIKAVEKAMKLEGEASDLIALKGMILCGLDYDIPAAECFEEAFRLSHDEQYLLLKGQAYLRIGNYDKACQCFKVIEDQSILTEAGIEIADTEKICQNFSKMRNITHYVNSFLTIR